ncbi:hypothetical protein M0802_005795 [Mischocyttarus mexicanus]|nr:hypothetical protein M0802_005795 [Mischocyttarus mexicanus]
MTKPLDIFDGFSLNDLLSPEGFTFKIGNEYLQEKEQDECSSNSNVFLSNDEIIDMINIDNFKNDDAEDYESAVTNVIGISFATLKSKMLPVTEDGKVMKLIKRKGVGVKASYDALVTIKYISFFEYNDEPFDSTFAQGKPRTVRLDQGLLIPGLELALTTMEKHEISIFTIHPDLAYGQLGCPPRILPNAEVIHGKALIKIGEYARGLKELELAYKMEPKNKDIYREICLANEKYNQYCQLEKQLWFNCFNVSGNEKRETEFQKAAREMCKSFSEDNYLSSQPFPEGLTQEEENCIREQAAAFGLNVVNYTRDKKTTLHLTKRRSVMRTF